MTLSQQVAQQVRINRAWLYKDPKGLSLQASAQLG